jgi:hypothetical protein
MENGWSLKHLHRLIVTSATYRQSSAVTPELQQRDPYNRLLARGRASGSTARSSVTSRSPPAGCSTQRLAARASFPLARLPLPATGQLWSEELVRGEGENRYRRALYTFRYRSVPYPDAPELRHARTGISPASRRSRSNTPLQALTTLNEPLFMEAARALAWKTVREGGTDRRRSVCASPSGACSVGLRRRLRSSELLGLLRPAAGAILHRARPIRGTWRPTIPTRPARCRTGVRMEEIAAWTAVSRVLLNLDETITKE